MTTEAMGAFAQFNRSKAIESRRDAPNADGLPRRFKIRIFWCTLNFALRCRWTPRHA
jgi:hypothetical protein